MVTPQEVYNGTAFQLKKASYDSMSDIKNDNPERIKIKGYPAITDMICDVLHKNERKSIKCIQLKATTLGTSKIDADPRIATLQKKYESVLSHIENDDNMKTYSLMRKQVSYSFVTTPSFCSGINLSMEQRDVSILSDIAKYMGIYPNGLFIISFLMGVRESFYLNEYIKSKMDKEISSFYQDLDRRIAYLSMLIPQESNSDKDKVST